MNSPSIHAAVKAGQRIELNALGWTASSSLQVGYCAADWLSNRKQ